MKHKNITAVFVSLLLPSCFTMAISDPSGKDEPVSDTTRKILLPATVTADVITAPAQVIVAGGYVATKSIVSSRKKSLVPSYEGKRSESEE